tara:strand:+ start:659 stop:1021 length:363 start_codon:yes stop_codon:yes gene_type:complete
MLFVACIFCNLTRRVDAEPYMWKFFDRYPDPRLVTEGKKEEIQKMIQPLGLSERRTRSLVRMSQDYLSKKWTHDPTVLYGIGKYGSDAYRIFCEGDWINVQPKDHALNDYHSWLKNNFKN